jgi:hypothetical protein
VAHVVEIRVMVETTESGEVEVACECDEPLNYVQVAAAAMALTKQADELKDLTDWEAEQGSD